MSRKIKTTGYNRGKSWLPRKSSWWSFVETRKEMVAPYLGEYDSIDIVRAIRDQQLALLENLYKAQKAYPPDAILKPYLKGFEQFKEYIWSEVMPKHTIIDIYNLYYTKSVDQEYAIIDDSNRGKWRILESVNDSSLKIITNQSIINSVIFTSEIVGAILRSIFTSLDNNSILAFGEYMDNVKAEQSKEEEDENNDSSGKGNGRGDDKEGEDSKSDNGPSESQDSQSSDTGSSNDGENKNKDAGSGSGKNQDSNGEGSGEGNKDGQSEGEGQQPSEQSKEGNGTSKFDQLVNKLINNDFDNNIAHAKNQAFKKISEFDQSGISTKEIEKYAHSALKIIDGLDTLKKNAKEIADKAPNIKGILEDIIDKGVSYFSKKYQVEDVSIFESDTIDDLSDIEYFHPLLKRMFIEDISTSNYKYKGKLNVYIDVSSSMNSECKFNNAFLDKIVFAKSLVLKMMELDMVNKVIPFGNYVKLPVEPLSIINVLLLDAHDGTCIDRVIQDCEKLQENGIVVTDCQDNLFAYSTKCFILGTPDAKFNLRGAAEQFKGNKQLWAFDKHGIEIVAH